MGQQVYTFLSKKPGLQVPGPRFHTDAVVGGQVVRQLSQNQIHFINHKYETDNPEVAKYLRDMGPDWYGKFYLEAPKADNGEVKVPKKGKPKVVAEVATRNEAISYLVEHHQVMPDELKGKKVSEIAEYALEKYHVNFTKLAQKLE